MTATNTNTYGSGVYDYLNFQGTTTNLGTISFAGSITQAQFTSGALVNRGTILISDASPIVSATTGSATPTIENDNVISVTNPDSVYQSPVIGANITGTGTIFVGTKGKIDFSQGVGSGQTLSFTGGVNASSVVQVDQPGNFKAVIAGFVTGDTITVTNTPYTAYSYTATSGSSGTINLFSGATLEGSLTLNGIYSANVLSLSYQQLDTTHSNLVITTTVTNPATGANTGSTGGNSLPVYRFFDTVFGTHLFTQSLSEAQQILATRPDLTEETNNFGAVNPQVDASAEPVYRFFETSNGTHFFTANYNEYIGLVTPGSGSYRPDLTYEASSTFYEDSTQQAGDVPVYRLFDTVHGTQFLTGSQTEYTGLTTPGSSTYRSNLTPEGISFYAPSGSFST